jgi:pimeloyl-ACP methyl ester carboxylesterase
MDKENPAMTAAPSITPAPGLRHVQGMWPRGLHRMAYWEWGDRANSRVLVCVHGLSRQGRDFDTLAAAMCDHYRVVCPDVVGRGHSDRLADPTGYAVPNYVADMVTLLARLDAAELHWVGTSMGGLIGMGLAALPDSPIGRLVLNDVGPTIEYAALQRIQGYLGRAIEWDSIDEAADALWEISRGFGAHNREQWLALTRPMLRQNDNGRWHTHYDPAIAVNVRATTPALAQAGEAMLWAAYDRIACPTLVLRGAESDLLSPATAAMMAARGPKPRVVEIEGVGHAPMLVQADQIAIVRAFLTG